MPTVDVFIEGFNNLFRGRFEIESVEQQMVFKSRVVRHYADGKTVILDRQGVEQKLAAMQDITMTDNYMLREGKSYEAAIFR